MRNLSQFIFLHLSKTRKNEPSGTPLAEKHWYLVRDKEMLLEALEPLAIHSGIIQHYCQYLEPIYRDSVLNRSPPGDDVNSDEFYRMRSKYIKFVRLL